MADKFKELVHYICHRMSDEPARLGAIKLNKILWYSDISLFRIRGKPITDSKYIKQPLGPVAKSLPAVLDVLQSNGIVVSSRKRYPSGQQHIIYFSTEEPNLSNFSAEEIAVVDRLIDIICFGHSAKSISDLSHDLTWQMHKIGEEMPLYRSHVMELGQIDADDVAWARGSSGVG